MKGRLRKKYIMERLTLSSQESAAKSALIQEKAMATEAYRKARRISLYLASEGEAKTEAIMEDCLRMKKETYVARINGKTLEPVKVTKSTGFAKGMQGLTEPEGNAAQVTGFDVIIVPLVAFDTKRNRLGRGGGHYDRYLSQHPGYRIGLAFDMQEAEEIPAEGHDEKLDAIITETRTI
ncbi:5-formyltetrahydrofolate cyclo-ligase [Candidatus Woesearchaeota archaeon]|nr:5-formyltetrahydrofolate cyclo-ligase [Candidatus Woesearchaeota archaeon]